MLFVLVSVHYTIDDILVEGDEDFDLVLTMTDQMPNVVVGTSGTTVVTIPANDGTANNGPMLH